MTANDIDVLIHYYCTPDPHVRIDAPAVKLAIFRFVNDCIFEQGDNGKYYVTEKGNAFVRRILQVPYPELIWTYKEELHGN